jgi:macrophage erythroblast attacher
MESSLLLKERTKQFVLESSDFLHTPVELLSRSFRRSQRFVEKHIVANVKLASRAKSRKALESIRARIEKLERNLSRLESEEEKYLTQIEDRVQSVQDGTRDPMSRFVCDFLARTGKFDCARKIASDQGLESFVDIDLWKEFHNIRSAILNQDCKSALKWCDENASKLRRIDSDFSFRLHVQTFLEQARNGDVEGAIEYAQKNVSPFVTRESKHYVRRLRLSRRAMSCLIFSGSSSSSSSSSYPDLLSESRWNDLSMMFETEFRRVYGCTKYSSLRQTLEAGLAAMRTPKCSDRGRHEECPGCDKNLGRVASAMPLFRSANTRIVCPINGKIMNEANPPMAMPSGHVYSLDAIHTMTDEQGLVKCPVTNISVALGETQRVYIM